MANNRSGKLVQHHKVKAWQKRKKELRQRINFVQQSIKSDKDRFDDVVATLIKESQECNELAERTKAAKDNLGRLNDRLDEMINYPKVTEHAMLRFCQRVLSIPIGMYARTLIPKAAADHIRKSSDGRVVIEGMYGFTYVVAFGGNHINSVWIPDERDAELPRFSFTASEAWRLLCEEDQLGESA